MCTIVMENAMTILKNQLPLRSCYLLVRWTVAASSLTMITSKMNNCTYFKTYDYSIVKNSSYR